MKHITSILTAKKSTIPHIISGAIAVRFAMAAPSKPGKKAAI